MDNRFFTLLFLFIFLISCSNQGKDSKRNANDLTGKDSVQDIERISALISENPENADLFVQRSGIHIENNQLEEAINDLKIAVKLDSLNPKNYIQLAELQLKLGRSGKAKDILESCLIHNPENTDALIRLANIYFYVKDYKRSMEWLNKCQEVDRNLAQIYFTKGMIYKENEDIENSIKNFQIAVEKETDYYDAYILLGLLHTQMKDSLAIAYYRNAIRIIPSSIEAHYNLAMFLQENNLEKRAIAKYEYILSEIDSLQPDIYYNIAFVHMNYMKDYKSAIDNYNAAIRINNNFTEAYYNRGYCFENLKLFTEARKDYTMALQLVENYELAIDGLNRLDQY